MKLTIEQTKEVCADNFAVFARTLQDVDWYDDVHETLCEQVQTEICKAVEEGRDAKVLVVMARGSLKTTFMTKFLPAWLATPSKKYPWKGPELRGLIATNSHTNAKKKMKDLKSVYESDDIFRALWPELLPTKKQTWTDESACLPRSKEFPESTFEGCGVKSRKVGTHYNYIIEDDTVAPEESDIKNGMVAPSSDCIEKGIGWHKTSTALLMTKGVRIRIIVTTRWGSHDLVSHVEDNETYVKFDIPAIQEDGTPTFKIFYDKAQLKSIEEQMGPYLYSALYLNKPIDAALRKFKEEWLKRCWVTPRDIPECDFASIAIDPAISEKDEACETAITKVQHYVAPNKKVHQYWTKDAHDFFDPLQIATTVIEWAIASEVPVKYLIVETIAYQAALKYILYDEMARRKVNFRIIEAPRGNKNAKIEGMIPGFAIDRTHLVKGMLTAQVESQLRQFPHGNLVDIIDSFSMHQKVGKRERLPKAKQHKEDRNPFLFENVVKEIKVREQRKSGGLEVVHSDVFSGLTVEGIFDDETFSLN